MANLLVVAMLDSDAVIPRWLLKLHTLTVFALRFVGVRAIEHGPAKTDDEPNYITSSGANR